MSAKDLPRLPGKGYLPWPLIMRALPQNDASRELYKCYLALREVVKEAIKISEFSAVDHLIVEAYAAIDEFEQTVRRNLPDSDKEKIVFFYPATPVAVPTAWETHIMREMESRQNEIHFLKAKIDELEKRFSPPSP